MDKVKGEIPSLYSDKNSKLYKNSIKDQARLKQLLFYSQQKLISPQVSIEEFGKCAVILSPNDYKVVIEERNHNSLCGYPLCNKLLDDNKISILQQLKQKEKDLESKFCCIKCMNASTLYSNSLSEEALAMRPQLRSILKRKKKVSKVVKKSNDVKLDEDLIAHLHDIAEAEQLKKKADDAKDNNKIDNNCSNNHVLLGRNLEVMNDLDHNYDVHDTNVHNGQSVISDIGNNKDLSRLGVLLKQISHWGTQATQKWYVNDDTPLLRPVNTEEVHFKRLKALRSSLDPYLTKIRNDLNIPSNLENWLLTNVTKLTKTFRFVEAISHFDRSQWALITIALVVLVIRRNGHPDLTECIDEDNLKKCLKKYNWQLSDLNLCVELILFED